MRPQLIMAVVVEAFDGVRWSPEIGQFAKLAANEDEDEQRGWQTEELQRGLQGEGGA